MQFQPLYLVHLVTVWKLHCNKCSIHQSELSGHCHNIHSLVPRDGWCKTACSLLTHHWLKHYASWSTEFEGYEIWDSYPKETKVVSVICTQPLPTYSMIRVPDNDTMCDWYIQQKCCKYTLNKTGFNPSRRSPWSLKLKNRPSQIHGYNKSQRYHMCMHM